MLGKYSTHWAAAPSDARFFSGRSYSGEWRWGWKGSVKEGGGGKGYATCSYSLLRLLLSFLPFCVTFAIESCHPSPYTPAPWKLWLLLPLLPSLWMTSVPTTAGHLMPQPLVPLLPDLWRPFDASQAQVFISVLVIINKWSSSKASISKSAYSPRPLSYFFRLACSNVPLLSFLDHKTPLFYSVFSHYPFMSHNAILAGSFPCPWDSISFQWL